jgi:small nuclear ribonucleoprotein (snRNP)-like protein
MLVDWSLVLTLTFLFVAALAGAWLRARRVDSCLHDFNDYHVTLELANGKLVWGTLKVTATGIELHYRHAVQDDYHVEASYVLYQPEYPLIQAIYRYARQLDGDEGQRRHRDVHRWFHPGPFRFLLRKLRSFLAISSDALNEVVSVLIGKARRPTGAYLSEQGEAYLKRFGGELIVQAALEHDPLLESLIGQRVVVEIAEDNEVHEHVGIFKNYSADFFEFLDLHYPVRQTVPLYTETVLRNECIQIVPGDGSILLTNQGDMPVLVQALEANGKELVTFDVLVDPGESVTLVVGAIGSDASLRLRTVQELDLIVPRHRCIIRHRAAPVVSERLPDIIFDLGIFLRAGDREQEREKRFREQLELDPNNALAAAQLGALLLRCGNDTEAAYWLDHALARRESLPDRGRRVEMERRELERRYGRKGNVRPAVDGTSPSVPLSGSPSSANHGNPTMIPSPAAGHRKSD